MAVTNYVWSHDRVTMEKDGGGTTTKTYTQSVGQYGPLVSDNSASSSRQYHFDALGSTRAMTDDNETVTDSFIYDAWGTTKASSGSSTSRFLYIGKYGYYSDAEIDALYVRARYYSVSVSRFSSSDPLSVANSLNTYWYSDNMPVLKVDPSGMLTTEEYLKCFQGDGKDLKEFNELNKKLTDALNSTPCKYQLAINAIGCQRDKGIKGYTRALNEDKCDIGTSICVSNIIDCKEARETVLHESAMKINTCMRCKKNPNCVNFKDICKYCLCLEYQAAKITGACKPGGAKNRKNRFDSEDTCLLAYPPTACIASGACKPGTDETNVNAIVDECLKKGAVKILSD